MRSIDLSLPRILFHGHLFPGKEGGCCDARACVIHRDVLRFYWQPTSVCLKNIYKYRVLGEGGGAEEWCFYYNAWNDDNTIVERGNSNIVIRGMVKGSKQNTKSRLNSEKTLSLPLFFLHVHSPFVLSSLSLFLFLHLLFLLAHFLQQRCATFRFRKRSQISCRFLFAGISNFPSPPRCLIWKLNPPDGDLFWRNLYRLRSSGNATLRAQLLPRLLRGNFIMRFRE